MASKKPDIDSSWYEILSQEFTSSYMQELRKFLKKELKNQSLFPPMSLVFNVFKLLSLQAVKVVILGQDPYHQPGQAHGLSFSVPKGISPPPSLKNIYQEISSSLNITLPNHGDLTNWVKQGVFLLNSVLTVRQSQPGSHQNKGWEQFTDRVIEILSQQRTGLVFLLWGKYARNKKILINIDNHLVLETTHPSPFSARYWFFGIQTFCIS